MYTPEALIDMHERGHRSFGKLLAHCVQFSQDELHRELAGFGYPTLQLQLHHMVEAEDYWIGVLQDRLVEGEPVAYPTIESLEAYRLRVTENTDNYLRQASAEELNTPRVMRVWTDMERDLMPAQVFLRTLTHIYHHQGQVLAMCRILGKPGPEGMDFPLL